MGEILQEQVNRTSDFEANPLFSLTIENGVTPKTDRYERGFLVRKEEELFKIVRPEEFVTNPMNLRFGALGYNSNPYNISVSGYYDVFSIDENRCSSFWSAYFKTPVAIRKFDNAATGSLIEKRRVKYSTLTGLDFAMPVSTEEKIKIGKHFASLDNLITLHQRKFKKVKNIKKSCLSEILPLKGECIPKRRSMEFTNTWEQRKLGEVAENFEYGLNAAATEFDGVNKYIRITDIDDESHQFKKDDLTSPDTNLELAGRYKLEKGDILFARTGASVGKSYIYRGSDGLVYYAGFLIRGRIKPDFNTEFIFQNTLTENYEKYIRITSQRSGQPGVNAQEYQEFTFKIPKREEQKKIGKFFRDLDNLITLHRRKLEKLENIKKSCLEKMFV